MKKYIRRWGSYGLILMISFLLVTGCATQSPPAATNASLKVVTTVYPVYEFARQVGGDKAEVSMLLKPGTEPHDWEPTPQELARIKAGKLFLYHGAGLEPVTKILTKDVLGNSRAVEVSGGIAILTENESKTEETPAPHGHNRGEERDVHTWLDPVNAQQEVKVIAAAMADADPLNADYYRLNAEKYCRELEQLDGEYREALASVKRRDIITSHAAFGYLAKRYQLHQEAIMGLSPDSEPTAEKMATVVAFCREHKVKFIFFETLVSPKLSKTIAQETGTELLVLNPLESLTADEVKQGKNYLTVMRDNLMNLRRALE
ncbi:MAG TPA: metal ABC transporter substrate-binding protein [Patescibacteria group bacterium]|nr:metal ABC transporter substrate-binding protein [Patescibacteria group bacterium]